MQAFQGFNSSSNQEASVSKLANSLPPFGNTIISRDLVKKHLRSWQAHLERISDFLLLGKGSWWLDDERGNVEFLDGEKAASTYIQGPLLHHFRSSSFSAEEDYLRKCWNECLENGVTLPIKDIRVEDEHGQMKIVRRPMEEDTTKNNRNVGIVQQPVTVNSVHGCRMSFGTKGSVSFTCHLKITKLDALTDSVDRLIYYLSSETALLRREDDVLPAGDDGYDPTCSITGDDAVVETDAQSEVDSNALPDSDLFNNPDQCGEEVSKELANRVDLACTKKPAKDKLSKIQDRYLGPKNCTMLVAPRVNPELWEDLPDTAKMRDVSST